METQVGPVQAADPRASVGLQAPPPDPAGRSRIGVFGGTFDPFHLGHLVAGQEVVEALALDQLLLVPAALPPHKVQEDLVPGALRMRMIREAVEGDARFSVSDVELRRDGPSFTVDTLRELRSVHPEADLCLLMGADQWATFGTWRDPLEIARLATLVVMTRAGEGSTGDAGFPPGEAPACREVPVPRIDISSSDIRKRVREGRSIRYLVPDEGRRIIEAAKLYR